MKIIHTKEKQLRICILYRNNLAVKLVVKKMLGVYKQYFLYFRCQELEAELQKLKSDYDLLKSRTNASCDSAAPMISSVAKVVQPTATVSSVPVSGPSNKKSFSCLKFFNVKYF